MSTRSALFALASLALVAACGGDPLSPVGTAASASSNPNGGSKVAAPAGTTTTSATRVEIALTRPTGAPLAGASGKAKFDPRGSRRELEVEIEHIPVGTSVTFFLGGSQIGAGVADGYGNAELELSTQRGHTVPTSVAGLTVEVKNADGAVLVTGIFP